MTPNLFKKMTLAALVSCAFAGLAVAGDPFETKDFASHSASKEEFIDALKPPVKTRGLKKAREKAVSLELTFELNSDRLTPEAKSTLDRLGAALTSDELSTYSFDLLGHTDASGSADYNMTLSRKRAESVRQYLVGAHQVNASRLKSIGKGETALKDEANPNASTNRRVQIVNKSRYATTTEVETNQ